MAEPNSLVAADLIRSARDEHPSFADERRHPKETLLRGLSRYQRTLASKVLKRNNAAMVTTFEEDLPLADFAAGVEVPDYKYPGGVEAIDGQGVSSRIDLVPWQSRNGYLLAAYLRAGVLYLTGTAVDWVGFVTLRFFYVPEVEALTALTGAGGTLVLPNAAEPCLVAFLAYLMAKRGHKDETVEKPDVTVHLTDWQAAEKDFLDEMHNHSTAESSIVRETF